MPPHDASTAPNPCTTRWWCEWEVLVLVLLVAAGYFIRVGALPLRGEEPTRAQTAWEMVETGNWLVPTEQGDPFLQRPPMQFWFIAGSCVTLGTWNEWAVRLPSVVATLLTTLLIYGYSRVFLSRLGAFAAAAAFATMADIFKMGLYAETEAVFIGEVAGALLVWHWGVMRRWPDWLSFGAGYSLVALGMLTKGFQPIVYFGGGMGIFLVVTGQWRKLFSLGHLIGVLVMAALLLAWIIPYGIVLGFSAVPKAWFGDTVVTGSGNVLGWDPLFTLTHLITYPIEVVAATLPWSPLLLLYLRRDFRQALGAARPAALYLAICIGFAWPTCWIPPTLTRHFAPLFPAMAVLIGLAIQRCAEAAPVSVLRGAWRSYLRVLMPVIVIAPVGVVALAIFGAPLRILEPWVEPPRAAIAYAVAFTLLAALMLRVRAVATPLQVRLSVFSLVVFLVILFNGVVTDVRVHRSVNVAASVRELKEKLPPGQPLVSIGGHVDCLFPYYYGPTIITSQPWPTPDSAPDPNLTYFCFNSPGAFRPALPFAWEEIGVIVMDRNRLDAPERVVVVGRRLPAATGTLPAMPVSGAGR